MKYEYRCKFPNCNYTEILDFPIGEAPADYYAEDPDDDEMEHYMVRVFSVAGVLFKGHGFHRTDYPNSKGRKYAT